MKRVFNLIVMDESGSMSIIEKQALVGMNETIDTIKKLQKAHPDMEQHVTLLTFDSNHCRFIYNNVLANKTRQLSPKEYNPCGGTPLYDAIGTGIAKLNAQTTPEDNVLVTIITDGEENCSQEYNLQMIQTLIAKLKAQNWTFSLIGTDALDVEGMAGQLHIDNHLSFCQDEDGTREMFRRERRARGRFNEALCSMASPMAMTDYFKNDDEK